MNGCAIDGYLDCAQVLFEWTKSVNQQQPRSLMTPIMCACHHLDPRKYQLPSLDMIQWLIEAGADIEMRSKGGYTAMDFALGASWNTNYKYLTPVENVRADQVAPTEVLKFLYNAKARPSEKFKSIFEIAITRQS